MSDPEHYDHSSVDVWEDEGGANDDVWGNDDDVSYDRAIAQKEWDRLHENFGNTGYREGIEEGKEGTLQQGFNQGWSEGVQYGHELGRLRGLISPFLEYIRSSPTAPWSQIEDKEEWITRAAHVVKELVELDIAKVFDKAYFDDGRGPSSSPASNNKEKKKDDGGCCGGSAEGSGVSSCCQNKDVDADVDAGSEAEPTAAGSSTPSTGCCGGKGGEGSCQSNKSNSCKAEKKDDGETVESEWSSKPEQVVNEYRSRVRALLLEANMEALSLTV
ncbi:hypothetical protein EC957_006380 [Mortierella hygrophila]|uniref:Protein YAE1 n=1 Tax=Mortierella hygrophila TaxID=979708 RepID=A0A9P6EZ67_9FUNG|nr:hypothetical protein EC957_006380 [Mortierella hygrophila]